jgi:hypothetical protein
MPTPKTTYAVKQAFPTRIVDSVIQEIPPSVIVVFRGLLTFCFSGNQNCEVGINNHAHGLPAPQTHRLNIKLWRRRGVTCEEIPMTFPTPTSGIDLQVRNPAELDGVYVHQHRPKDPFDRITTSAEFDRDIRWMFDMEGLGLHDRRLEKNRARLRPSLNIDNGIFYTRQKTSSTFVLFEGGIQRPIGPVAKLIAANIYLNDRGAVDLKVNGPTVVTLVKEPDTIFQIDFTNDCSLPGIHCGYDPGNMTKETRNDFYLHYETFTRPAGKEFELRIDTRRSPVRDPGLCGTISDEGVETTDPAPCMGVLFGQTPSLD